MKALKKNGLGGGLVAALLVMAVLGLVSLTGCASAPYMPNPVDVTAGSEEDPFAGTKWDYKAEGAGLTQTGNLSFYKDGTVSWTGSKPKKYTLVSSDAGYMAEIKGGVFSNSLWLTIDNPNASEGNVKVQLPAIPNWGMEVHFSATKNK